MVVVQKRGGWGLDQGGSCKDGQEGTGFRVVLEIESVGLGNGLR